MNKTQIILAIRKEKYWNVTFSGNRITVVKRYGGKNISFILVSKKEGYIIEHPSYVFTNKISHFKSLKEDIRLSLNKNYLKSVIRLLKKTGIWHSILNKKFIDVNDSNSRSDKGKVAKELNDLLD